MHHRSLGIPPLGGIATYEEAAQPGLSVEQNVRLLKRYAYVERRLAEIAIAHLCAVPEWEVKCALALHCWLDTEHATVFRQRVAEMRKPPLHLDQAPDERLAAFLDEAIFAADTVELLGGIYRVARPALAAAYRRHLARTNPLADHPTRRHLVALLAEEEEMIAWGEAALRALLRDPTLEDRCGAWVAHLQAYLAASGGIVGDGSAPATPLPTPRATTPFVADLFPRRDARFGHLYNSNGANYEIAGDTQRPLLERTMSLMWRRLVEMDVPEYMAGIIVRTPGKPWEYYREMTRQLWDEARHAMMGEVAFESLGIDWTALPIPTYFSYILNTHLTPLESHARLYSIEQRLMDGKTGKRFEWELSRDGEHPLFETFQDYDWADEVLHAQIGRRWLVPELGDREQVAQVVEDVLRKEQAALATDPLLAEADSTDWWPGFYAQVEAMVSRNQVDGGGM